MEELVERRTGPIDCEDSEFSAYDVEEKVRSIEGVIDVSGEYGSPLYSSDRAEVTADINKKDDIIPKVRRLLGMSVKYHWLDPEEK